AARAARRSSSCSAPPPRASSPPPASTVRAWSCSRAKDEARRAEGSGSRDVREVLGAVLAQHAAHPLALRLRGHAQTAQQLALALDRLAGDHPPDREALEQQLERSLAGVLDGLRGAPRAGRGSGVLAARPRRERAAQAEDVSLSVAVVARRRLQPLAPTRAPAHALDGVRGAFERSAHVSGGRLGVSGPGGGGLERGELADARARLLGVEVVERRRQ